MSCRSGSVLRWAALVFLSLCPLLLCGQDNAQNAQANQKPRVTNPLLVNVTGCLKKDSTTGGYYVTDQDGRRWELTSKKLDLARQIFHTVSVSGHPSAGSNAQAEKSEQARQPEAGQNLTLNVTELEMLSNSCTR
jgi:hypothetical protein